MCVELYRQGKWVKHLKELKQQIFVTRFVLGIVSNRLADRKHCVTKHITRHGPQRRNFELVSQVNAGQSMMAVACQYGMSYSLFCTNGFVNTEKRGIMGSWVKRKVSIERISP